MQIQTEDASDGHVNLQIDKAEDARDGHVILQIDKTEDASDGQATLQIDKTEDARDGQATLQIYHPPPNGEEAVVENPPLCDGVMKSAVASILVLLTLKYRGIKEMSPIPTWCYLASTTIYWLIVGIMKQKSYISHYYYGMLAKAAISFSALAIASAASLFVPRTIWFIPLVIWIPVPAWPLFRSAYIWLHKKIDKNCCPVACPSQGDEECQVCPNPAEIESEY